MKRSIFLFTLVFSLLALAAKPVSEEDRIPKSMIEESALDRGADPCKDFYQFACGGWLKTATIPADRSAWSRSFSAIAEHNQFVLKNILQKYASGKTNPKDANSEKLGNFYAACMDEKQVERHSRAEAQALIDGVTKLTDKKEIAAKLAGLHLDQVDAFFNVGSFQDYEDTSREIAAVDQGGLGLPDRDYYLTDTGKMPQIRKLYIAHIIKMFELLGRKPKEAKTIADTVMKLETQLAKASMSRVDRRDPKKIFHKMDRKALQKETPGFSWDAYFTALGYSKIDSINVAVPDFMTAFDKLVAETSLDDLKVYLQWHLLETIAPALNHKFVDEQFQFASKALTGEKKLKVRWKRCVAATEMGIGQPLGHAFVEETFGEEGKVRAKDILKNVEASFHKNLEDLTWMDKKTKDAALVKLSKVFNQIGYPDKWRDFSGLQITRKSYLSNLIASNIFNSQYDLNKIGKPTDRNEWDMLPEEVNAYYSPENNKMVFPAGILQIPFFSRKAEDSLNYGAIGMVMGHELTHGFDDEGRHFDAKGDLKDWWSPDVAKAFSKRAECLVNQYNGYSPIDNLHVNGKLTLGENIADNGGIKLAYYALGLENTKNGKRMMGLNAQQQYFVSFAQSWCTKRRPEYSRMLLTVDPHSPAQFRVNGPLRNFDKFAEAFSCKKGSPMAPANACTVW